jgi:hypothetical protein
MLWGVAVVVERGRQLDKLRSGRGKVAEIQAKADSMALDHGAVLGIVLQSERLGEFRPGACPARRLDELVVRPAATIREVAGVKP